MYSPVQIIDRFSTTLLAMYSSKVLKHASHTLVGLIARAADEAVAMPSL